jgi:hypothetical protein
MSHFAYKCNLYTYPQINQLLSITIATRCSTVEASVSITNDCYRLMTTTVDYHRHALLHGRCINIDHQRLSINDNCRRLSSPRATPRSLFTVPSLLIGQTTRYCHLLQCCHLLPSRCTRHTDVSSSLYGIVHRVLREKLWSHLSRHNSHHPKTAPKFQAPAFIFWRVMAATDRQTHLTL